MSATIAAMSERKENLAFAALFAMAGLAHLGFAVWFIALIVLGQMPATFFVFVSVFLFGVVVTGIRARWSLQGK